MKRKTLMGMIAALVLAVGSGQVGAANLGMMLLKGAAIGYAVKQSSGPLNKFINTVTLQHGMASGLATKVVPVLSVGDKGYIGGAQVSGPKSKVDAVKAVFQYEMSFDNGRYRIKALVPSSSLNPLQLKRVDRVGVSAMIDVSLDGGLKKAYFSDNIGSAQVIRAAAVAVGIKAAAGPINKAINTITFNKGLGTAIVPMASFGEKAYVGGAQVSGSLRTYGRVKAVWQYEDIFSNGQFRVKVLVPTNSINPIGTKRVQGAGISALIDTTIADQHEADNNSWRGRDSSKNDDNHYRHDNGKHKGWFKNKDREERERDDR